MEQLDTILSKECFCCNTLKPLSEYYKHKEMTDGHLGKCKTCCKKQSKERLAMLRNNPEWVESERTRGRNKFHRLYKGIKASLEVQKKAKEVYKNKYPEKIAARSATSSIKIPNGKHGHHWSYNKEHYKDLIYIDIPDHYTAHRFIIYDQERKMYRGLDGVLLDSKSAHIEYINKYISNPI